MTQVLERQAVIDDIPVDMIYKFEYGGSSQDLPRKFSMNRTKVFDQNVNKDTRYACTTYGLTHCKHDGENNITIDPRQVWLDEAIPAGAKPTRGRSMQACINLFTRNKYIQGYANAPMIADMKNSLLAEQAIYTGSNQIDWVATRKNNNVCVYTKNGIGHIVAIVGWDDDIGAFEIKNSSKVAPTYWIKYDNISWLYTRLSIITDPALQKEIKKTAEDRTIDLAIKQGISNGSNLDAETTRGQMAIMLGRIIHGLGHSDEWYLFETAKAGIWNAQDANSPILREHALIMCARVMGSTDDIELLRMMGISNLSNLTDNTTRRQAILLATRVWAKKTGNQIM